LPKGYTSNQTGAIACVLASVMWSLTAYAVTIMFGTSTPLYSVFVVIGWIIALSYIMSISHVFIAGIFWLACSMLYLIITPSILGTSEWYMLERGLFDFTYIIWYLISFAVIYFSYKSWKELQKK
jgi:hypothetical protein